MVNIESSYDSEISLLGIYQVYKTGTQKKHLYINVHSSILQNNQKVGEIQYPSMDKLVTVYIYNGIFNHKKH